MTVDATDDPARAIAEFALELSHTDIPAEVRLRALHHILDATGIAMASATFDFAHVTQRAITGLGGRGDVPVIGTDTFLSPRDAAILNGFLIHGLDFDDTHIPGVIHPTASAFPAAMSAAYHVGATGREMLTAYIAAVEVAARLGAVARGGFHQVGFHPTGLVGVFGATVGAGKLMGLNVEELRNALGAALSMASGSLEFLEDGAWNKRFHPGWAAAAGLTAAALGKEGFVGISRPFAGRFGLYAANLGPLSENCDMSLATTGLGRNWELMKTAIKPFPACHFTHGLIDAALALRRQGVALDTVERITALVPAEVIKTVCEPEANKKRPANSYDAQFSVPYLVSTAIKNGQMTLAELEDAALQDRATLALADRVSYAADPNSAFPKAYSGELVAVLKDGREVRHREHINRGADERPLTNDEIVQKYIANALVAAPAEQVSKMRETILALDTNQSVEAVMAGLIPARAA